MEAVCQSSFNPSSDTNDDNLGVLEKENHNELIVDEHAATTHTSSVMDLATTVASPGTLTEPVAEIGLTLDVEADQETRQPLRQRHVIKIKSFFWCCSFVNFRLFTF